MIPLLASETTSFTPRSPRYVSLRRKAAQMGSTSDVTISSLKTSHPPLLLALVAVMTATEPNEPPRDCRRL